MKRYMLKATRGVFAICESRIQAARDATAVRRFLSWAQARELMDALRPGQEAVIRIVRTA